MIRIAHLYYDLLNLFGESGNVEALTSSLKKQGVNVKIDYLSIGEEINFKNYDLFYIGSGSDENLILVLEDIRKYKKDISFIVDNNAYFISTGNSKDLFGSFFELNGNKYDGLGIFDYFSKQNPIKIVGESFMELDGFKPIVGFQNRKCVTQNKGNHLFKVINGHADNYKSSFEGYRENNFISTYLIGPLLVRNPHLTDSIVKDILTKKKIDYSVIDDTYEYKAYDEYLKNFFD